MFPLFWHEASPVWWQRTAKRRIWLNHSEGHCQGQKGQVWLIFTHFSVIISSIEVLPKCIASCSFSEVILVLFSNFNGVDWFLPGQKGPIWTFVIYLVQYLRNGACPVTNVCMKFIYKVIYDLSVDLVIFDLGSYLKVKSRPQTFQGVVFHKWYIIWLKFVWNTCSKSYVAFQFTF